MAKSEYGVVGYVDKAVQIVVIVVLVDLYLNTPTEPAKPTATPADCATVFAIVRRSQLSLRTMIFTRFTPSKSRSR